MSTQETTMTQATTDKAAIEGRVSRIFNTYMEGLNDSMIEVANETNAHAIVLARYVELLEMEVRAMRMSLILIGAASE